MAPGGRWIPTDVQKGDARGRSDIRGLALSVVDGDVSRLLLVVVVVCSWETAEGLRRCAGFDCSITIYILLQVLNFNSLSWLKTRDSRRVLCLTRLRLESTLHRACERRLFPLAKAARVPAYFVL